jgi:uncharacterized protein (TIGR02266 family)
MPDAKDSRNQGAIPSPMVGARGSQSFSVTTPSILSTSEPARAPRVRVAAQVKVRYESILDFHDSQAVNIIRSGMFLASENSGPVGSFVEFELALADGLSLLKGKGEVVRVTQSPVAGMGIRFSELDQESRRRIESIVSSNEREGRAPRVPLDFASEGRDGEARGSSSVGHLALHGATRVQPGLSVDGNQLRVRLTPLTVGYFTNNPLINIRLGGFVIPIEDEASLGAVFDVAILDNDGISLFQGRGKVVAKDGHRIGIRLSDIDKGVLARLQGEVGKLSPGGR